MPTATKNKSPWTTLSLMPLTGMLDIRSRPADLLPGAFRYKLNMEVTQEGKMKRRGGFTKAFPEYIYDADGTLCGTVGAHCSPTLPNGSPDPDYGGIFYHNHDFHHQGGTREPITLQYEHTKTDGSRMLIIGTKSRVAVLDEATGQYVTVLSGLGATGTIWRATSLQGYILLANGYDEVYAMNETTLGIAAIPELQHVGGADHYAAAKVILTFQSTALLMNVTVGGTRHMERIIWSDINGPLTWDPASHPVAPNPGYVICSYQDLDSGDEILAACELMNSVYIFTRRSIWRMTVSSDDTKWFDFTRVYSEPKNQTGCLVYPYTLVSDGKQLHYLSRESIYHYDPYMAAPECESEQFDWCHRAAGAIFTKADTKLDGSACNSPCAEYLPSTKELWISWPSLTAEQDDNAGTVNDWTLVLSLIRHTGDIVDHGYTSFVNYRSLPAGAQLCNEDQRFLAASGVDYCIKELGSVYYREMLSPPTHLTDDAPVTAVYYTEGYNSELRGEVPAGLWDREKIIRKTIIDFDATDQSIPCVIQAFIGNSQNLADPNDLGDVCAVQWADVGTKTLQCQNAQTISEMTAQGLRPSDDMTWQCYCQGRHLYYRFVIQNALANGVYPEAIGGEVYFSRIDFDVLSLPKP